MSRLAYKVNEHRRSRDRFGPGITLVVLLLVVTVVPVAYLIYFGDRLTHRISHWMGQEHPSQAIIITGTRCDICGEIFDKREL